MTKANDGGPAFPVTEANGCNNGLPGASLRDYLAAHAPITVQDAVEWLDTYGGEVVGPWAWRVVMDQLASLRFQYADAMLKAREKP